MSESSDRGASVRRRRLALAGMALGLSVAALDQMVLATAATAISAELGGLAHVPWLFSGYLLSSACTMPLWGRLGDLYGRRRVFQTAVALFVVASLVAATATSMELLVAARLLQGLGGGGLLTLPNAIVADLVEPRLRASYYALNTAVWAMVGLLGPLAGGLLVDGVGWRFIFYLNVPAGLAAIALMEAGHRLPHERVPHAVDYPGALMLAVSAGSLLWLVSQLGTLRGLAAGEAGLLLALSIGFAWVFVAYERGVEEPLVPPFVMRMSNVRVGLGVMALYGLVNFSVAVFVPLFAITVAGTSATEAGLRLLPIPVGLMLGSVIVGRLIAGGARYRFYPAVGLLLHATGMLLFSTLAPDAPLALGLLYCLITGLGAGGVNPVVTYALQHSVPAAQLGLVTALPAFTRVAAQGVGIAMLGALLALRLDTHLAALVPDAPLDLHPDNLAARAEDIRALGQPVAGRVVEACRRALSEIFVAMSGIMGAALLISLRLREGHMT